MARLRTVYAWWLHEQISVKVLKGIVGDIRETY